MDVALLASRLLLALVFVVAGLAKLADRPGSRQALVDFGLPGRLAEPLGVLLPLAELVVAFALLPIATAWWAALGAFALFALFIAGISFNLAHGRKPNCHCFGQLYSAPAGPETLARNSLLAVVAVFAIWRGPTDPGLSMGAWLLSMTAAERVGLLGGFAALTLIALEGWFLVQLFRQHGRLLVRLDALEAQLASGGPVRKPAPPRRQVGLKIGTPAPTFELPDLQGHKLSLDALRSAGRPLLLVFSDPGCGPCSALLPDLARWQREFAERLTIALVSQGSREANLARSTEHGLGSLLLEAGHAIADAYQVTGTPTGVLVRADGTMGSLLAEGPEAIQELVAHTLGLPVPTHECNCGKHNGNGNGHSGAQQSLAIGAPAPALQLPNLSGQVTDLADLRGRSTLLVFWNPQCGFCAQMLDALKAWESRPPVGAPELLVVSTGTVEANRAMGLRSPVVLNQDASLLRSFGAEGTPSAILVDAQGRIASAMAVGADQVLALARAGQGPVPSAAG